jgi:hypothetical protein
MINARVPTNRLRHILIQHFAIQDWKEQGLITLCLSLVSSTLLTISRNRSVGSYTLGMLVASWDITLLFLSPPLSPSLSLLLVTFLFPV